MIEVLAAPQVGMHSALQLAISRYSDGLRGRGGFRCYGVSMSAT